MTTSTRPTKWTEVPDDVRATMDSPEFAKVMQQLNGGRDQDILDIITTALEGGSNYWYDNARRRWQDSRKARALDASVSTTDAMGLPFYAAHAIYAGLVQEDNCILIDVPDLKTDENASMGAMKWQFPITIDKVRKGLARAMLLAPIAYADQMSENADASTADVILQLALFGEVIFG